MGCQRRILEVGLPTGRRIQLCLRPSTTGVKPDHFSHDPDITTNGVDQIPRVLLRSIRNIRDVTAQYGQTPMGSLPEHKFKRYVEDSAAYSDLPSTLLVDANCKFLFKVFVDDFMSLVITTSKCQVLQCGTAMMMGITMSSPRRTRQERIQSQKRKWNVAIPNSIPQTLLGLTLMVSI